MHSNYLRHLFRDLLIVAGSVMVAFILTKGGFIEDFLEITNGSKIISSIIAGAFFTSIFTVAPAIVGLLAIGEVSSPLFVAFFGAFGAMIIDIIIASFVRKDISRDLSGAIKRTSLRKYILRAFHFGFLRWVAFGLGALIISSPLPDEFGLFLLGMSKVRGWALPLIFYTANFIGIFLILEIASKI